MNCPEKLKPDCGIDYWESNHKTGRKVIIDRIELIDKPFSSRSFWVRYNGEESKKHPEATPTSISIRVRQLLTIRAKKRQK